MPADAGPHGWIVLDKPLGLSSGAAVAQVRRATGAKAGHAGTLDPLATGVLPVALGEATKTTSFATAGTKRYRFRVRWGIARATDDCEGDVTAVDPTRPGRAAIEAILPRFVGEVVQTPPAFSAIKIGGRRAYALARAAIPVELPPRVVAIHALSLVAVEDADHAEFIATVGKGTYIRALARDLATALGTVGHVAALRRIAVGPFTEAQAISLDSLATLGHSCASAGYLLPIETALDDIPALALTAAEAHRLRHGQAVTPCDPDQRAQLEGLEDGTIVSARHDRSVVALARVRNGGLQPVRIINR